MAKLVSKVYGDALFEEAMEKETLSSWYEVIGELKTVLAQNPEFMQLLNHPQIGKEEKIGTVERIFSGRIPEEILGFLVIVVEKGRQNELTAICNHFQERVKEFRKIGVVSVTSAMPLSDQQKEQVEKRILETTAYESLETEYQVDPKLLGGMVIRIGGRVADSSIRTRLEKIRRDLMKLQMA